MNRFEPRFFKLLAKGIAGDPKTLFLSLLSLRKRGAGIVFAAGLIFLILLGRGCTYQSHAFIGEHLGGYEKGNFRVTQVNTEPQLKKYGPETQFLEGCIETKKSIFCEERIKGESVGFIYETSNEYEALIQAKVGDKFQVLFNAEVPSSLRLGNRGPAVRVIHSDIQVHKANATRASFVGWAYVIWPVFFFMLGIWRIPVKERG